MNIFYQRKPPPQPAINEEVSNTQIFIRRATACWVQELTRSQINFSTSGVEWDEKLLALSVRLCNRFTCG